MNLTNVYIYFIYINIIVDVIDQSHVYDSQILYALFNPFLFIYTYHLFQNVNSTGNIHPAYFYFSSFFLFFPHPLLPHVTK